MSDTGAPGNAKAPGSRGSRSLYRAVTFQERLTAAEAENRRLDILLARAVDGLKDAGKDILAEVLETDHERERVTPERARPVVERPLSPHEMPVRYVTQRRRWGY